MHKILFSLVRLIVLAGCLVISAKSQAVGQIATLTAPANGSTTVDPTLPVQFSWTAVPNATAYFVYLGTSVGAMDVYGSSEVQGTSVTSVTLQPLKTYYVRMWTKLSPNGWWYYQDSSFTTSTGIARVQSPRNGAVNLNPTTVQITWNTVPNALSYFLYLGTTQGAMDLYGSGAVQTTSVTVPMPGATTVYARIFTQTAAGWVYSDSAFTTTPDTFLLQPANGSSQVDPVLPVQFSWQRVEGALRYFLYVGSRPGIDDVYSSGEVSYTSTSVQLQPNQTYFVRMWAKMPGGQWFYTDSSFQTGNGIAHVVAPANGATNVDPYGPITWLPASNVQAYSIQVATQPYGEDLYHASPLSPNVTSRIPWGLQPNTTYYITLYTEQQNTWTSAVTSFTTGGPDPLPADQNIFYSTVQNLTEQVREMSQPPTSPQVGAPLPNTALWQVLLDYMKVPSQGANCGDYATTLVTLFSQNRINSRLRALTLNGNGSEAHVLTEYWDPFNNKWSVADPTFGLVYFDPAAEIGQGAEEIQQYLLAGQYSSILPLWVTPYTDWYAANYYMDAVTIYNNVIPMGGAYNYAPNPAYPFLNEQKLSSVVGQSGMYLVEFANPGDSVTFQTGTASPGQTVVQTPLTADGWGSAVGLGSGWSIVGSTPPGMRIFTFKWFLF